MILSDTQDVIANVIVGECLGDIKVHWALGAAIFIFPGIHFYPLNFLFTKLCKIVI